MTYGTIQDIAQSNVAVLLPDTCILLDLIRTPRRDTVDDASMLAGRAIRDAICQSGIVGCIVAEQVRIEHTENHPKIRDDTLTAIQKLKDELKRIDKWSIALGHASQTDISHFTTRVPVAESVMCDILNSALSHATNVGITGRGFARVMQKQTPAKQGKDSIKDCVIVESYLEVAQSLRDLGHTGNIIFASSNTSEFLSGSPTTLNADISTEFASLGILYSRSLPETKHLLGV